MMTPSDIPGRDDAQVEADVAYESEGGWMPVADLADLEHPWLGLESFREDTREFFFGRETEIGELLLRLRSHPLLVLYGRSGLGKSSILTAGVIPRLREAGKRPLLVRMRFDDPKLDPAGQLASAVFGWGTRQFGQTQSPLRRSRSHSWVRHLGATLGMTLPDDYPSRLWLRLHYRHDPPEITHLILDQFEEVFTIGAQTPGVENRVRDVMAILIQGAVPDPIARLMAEDDAFIDAFDLDSVPVRVVIGMRDDYVYALNRWRRHLPALGQNTFELRALKGNAAFAAVYKPGELRCRYRSQVAEADRVDTGLPPIIDRDTAERIVRFIARKSPDTPMEEIEAVPPILSLLCRELNARRFEQAPGNVPASQVVFREDDAQIETIIAAFYERCLAGCPEAVRIFIEEELVSFSGARLAQDEDSLLRVFETGSEIPRAPIGRRAAGFGDAEAARQCLRSLVDQRLLNPVGDKRYELIHELLAQVVVQGRTARKERLDKETELERQASLNAERHARSTRRQRLVLLVALVITIITAGALFRARRTAEQATLEARGQLAARAFREATVHAGAMRTAEALAFAARALQLQDSASTRALIRDLLVTSPRLWSELTHQGADEN